MKLRQLEMRLEGLKSYQNPSPGREQYQTPAPLAARLLHHAYMQGDIAGRSVCDPGCGTGILSIGAALIGAVKVTGLDIDSDAIRIAEENAAQAGVHPQFICGDITDPGCIRQIPACDTVVMNPPFGAQAAHADRPFIETALVIGQVVYGIFNAGSRSFIEGYIGERATMEEVVAAQFSIRRTFAFHTRDIREIPVEIIKLRRVRS
ncbi:MAG: METTL5 family protein [Methanoregulaceae archaeon]|nr:METTL5 family protein [Methanoregulaceae archaeon]